MSILLKKMQFPAHRIRNITTAALFFLFYGLCHSPIFAADIQSPTEKTIVVLHSFKAKQPWVSLFNKYLTERLREQISLPHTIEIENLDLVEFNAPRYKEILRQQLEYKYSKHPPDVLVATFEPAIKLVLEGDLFQNSAKIFLQPSETGLTENPGAVVVPFAHDFKGSVDHTLTVLPDTREIYVVAGNAAIDVNTVSMFARETRGFSDRITFHYFDGLRTGEVLQRLGSLPPHSVVYYLSYSLDDQGHAMVAKDFCETVGDRSNRPVFTYYDLFALDTGILGGRVTTTKSSAASVVSAVNSLFQGRSVESIKIEPSGFEYIYDWREVLKWRIDEAKLPAGSVLQNRTPTFFELFKWKILGGILILILELLLILYLLANVKKRKLVEGKLLEAKENLEDKVSRRTHALSQKNKELLDSEQRFQSLSDAAFEGIIIIDNGKIVDANNTCFDLFGYERQDFTGVNDPIDFIASEDRENVSSKILSDYEQPYEATGLRKDGSVFPIELHGKVFSYKGRKLRVTAIRDLTEKKNAEEEIKILRGILPICASCKKIRDDEGYWNFLEAYIHKHSEAVFSHGICPDCIKKLYPELQIDRAQEQKKSFENTKTIA